MASRKKKAVFRDDEEELEEGEEEEGEEEEEEQDDEVEVPDLLDMPLSHPDDRALFTACFSSILCGAKMKGKKITPALAAELQEEAQNAFYAAVQCFGGRAR